GRDIPVLLVIVREELLPVLLRQLAIVSCCHAWVPFRARSTFAAKTSASAARSAKVSSPPILAFSTSISCCSSAICRAQYARRHPHKAPAAEAAGSADRNCRT